ncbi:MAG: heavy metal translocating P-type ATPase, partial [Lachnospiraceae bacterium]|nr:heavy metal translocating P-type ATPase [Lachnospiraceae bacterium]
MNFKIMHETAGRMRIRVEQRRMTLEQADILENYLSGLPGVRQATVHERTRCAILLYDGPRDILLHRVQKFSYEKYAPKETEQVSSYSPRVLNRTYEEKLVNRIIFKIGRRILFPTIVHNAFTIYKSIPYIWRGIQCIRKGDLKVELLDALSIGISLLRGDFETASS